MAPELPIPDLDIVVGYDGSPPANRALDAAVALRRGRPGRTTVVYVAHIPSAAMLSAAAVVEVEESLNQLEQDLRAAVAERLRGEERWEFVRRQGIIADELLAVAADVHEPRPHDTVVIVVGTSSRPMHRLVGSVAVSLAHHSSVPVVMVP
jgi:nucleotide-binding universal stress UspA family protein